MDLYWMGSGAGLGGEKGLNNMATERDRFILEKSAKFSLEETRILLRKEGFRAPGRQMIFKILKRMKGKNKLRK